MNRLEETPKQRKILVAIDASSTSLHYLERIAELASVLQAQLTGLYIEDEDLLMAAELPFTKEICFHVTDKPIDLLQLERDMKLFSAKAREHFEEIARRWQISGSFQTVRGKVIGELSQAAKTADILSCGLQVFRDLQNLDPNSESLSAQSTCLLFPDQIAHGEDIIVFASKDKPLEALLAPVNGLLQNSRLVVICSPEIYADNKETIDNYLQQAGHTVKESKLVISAHSINEWAYELINDYQPKLFIVDKNTVFANSKKFYALLALAQASGLLV